MVCEWDDVEVYETENEMARLRGGLDFTDHECRFGLHAENSTVLALSNGVTICTTPFNTEQLLGTFSDRNVRNTVRRWACCTHVRTEALYSHVPISIPSPQLDPRLDPPTARREEKSHDCE